VFGLPQLPETVEHCLQAENIRTVSLNKTIRKWRENQMYSYVLHKPCNCTYCISKNSINCSIQLSLQYTVVTFVLFSFFCDICMSSDIMYMLFHLSTNALIDLLWYVFWSYQWRAQWKNWFSHLLNVHRASDARQIEIHTAEPLVLDPRSFEVEIAIAKMIRYKSLGSDHILAELIQERGAILHSKIHKITNSIWITKNCLSVEGVYYCTSWKVGQ
jgi:hypothetical protein